MVFTISCYCQLWFNSLAPGKFEWNFRYVIFTQIIVIDGWGLSSEIALIWMSLDFTGDQTTLVQVMAWCRRASHCLSQCWPRSLLPYDLIRPQWVNSWKLSYEYTLKWKCHFNNISSMAALNVLKITTSQAASDDHFIKMMTFTFQCMCQYTRPPLVQKMTSILGTKPLSEPMLTHC